MMVLMVQAAEMRYKSNTEINFNRMIRGIGPSGTMVSLGGESKQCSFILNDGNQSAIRNDENTRSLTYNRRLTGHLVRDVIRCDDDQVEDSGQKTAMDDQETTEIEW